MLILVNFTFNDSMVACKHYWSSASSQNPVLGCDLFFFRHFVNKFLFYFIDYLIKKENTI